MRVRELPAQSPALMRNCWKGSPNWSQGGAVDSMERSSVREQPGNGRRQALCKEGPAINHRTGGKGLRALNKNYSRTLPELEKDYFHIKKNNRKQVKCYANLKRCRMTFNETTSKRLLHKKDGNGNV